jgi:hypothetical protein
MKSNGNMSPKLTDHPFSFANNTLKKAQAIETSASDYGWSGSGFARIVTMCAREHLGLMGRMRIGAISERSESRRSGGLQEDSA